jgi:hypothetical protein
MLESIVVLKMAIAVALFCRRLHALSSTGKVKTHLCSTTRETPLVVCVASVVYCTVGVSLSVVKMLMLALADSVLVLDITAEAVVSSALVVLVPCCFDDVGDQGVVDMASVGVGFVVATAAFVVVVAAAAEVDTPALEVELGRVDCTVPLLPSSPPTLEHEKPTALSSVPDKRPTTSDLGRNSSEDALQPSKRACTYSCE